MAETYIIPQEILSISDLEGFYDALAHITATQKIVNQQISSGVCVINNSLGFYHAAYIEVEATKEQYNNWRQAEKLKKAKAGNLQKIKGDA